MSSTTTTTMTPCPTKPKLGDITGGIHPWTAGKPDPSFANITRTVPQSAYCYHLQAPTDAHKQLKTKTMITLTGNSESIQKFSCDEKNHTVEEFAEHTMNHLEFHGMDSEFYLPDLKT